ncbi:hypothetical protein MPTK1_2g20700 [Marchantia polymorpha subsp. ruderalis]|uniref:Uncharacterized protein n=1 Tax=Marchantia polymorpha TaxID=3197 RepID=A0A2R6X2Z4_MARPO|nr:hypothetical protein MARPO_0040s0142 [Marchantia polymorpha]BBN03096.1 hypothetical protein Mp_2g20700 [Marchantia polymorpha subsp. ruderalis]|eukprot:PTQ40480.1 hypothetical protein MARPO_0040s0142 [Marchantia polymorpha]
MPCFVSFSSPQSGRQQDRRLPHQSFAPSFLLPSRAHGQIVPAIPKGWMEGWMGGCLREQEYKRADGDGGLSSQKKEQLSTYNIATTTQFSPLTCFS